jgi:hypothetical protein
MPPSATEVHATVRLHDTMLMIGLMTMPCSRYSQ